MKDYEIEQHTYITKKVVVVVVVVVVAVITM